MRRRYINSLYYACLRALVADKRVGCVLFVREDAYARVRVYPVSVTHIAVRSPLDTTVSWLYTYARIIP